MIKIFSEIIFTLLVKIFLFFFKIVFTVICFFRDKKRLFRKQTNRLVYNDVCLEKRFINIDGYKHLITQCGNIGASEENTIVMMGGIPSNPSESLYWMAAELFKNDKDLRILILHLPYYEEYSTIDLDKSLFAKFNALKFPFDREINLKKVNVDPKFSHSNQAQITLKIINKLQLKKAHFVGHDRGVIVFENLLITNPEIFLSLSRGSQVWDFYDDDWSKLAPKICVGPPHRYMAYPDQLRLLFILITFLKLPFGITEIASHLRGSKKGSEEYDRMTHLLYKANNPSRKFLLKVQQTFMQTDSKTEVKNREKLKNIDVKIMQFQGEDEFKYGKNGKLISDQPYFGVYNLFRNEVEDLFPDCIGQDLDKRVSHLIEEKKGYKKLKLLPKAKIKSFALIPKSSHFNVIENPKGCANAVYDFIKAF